VVLNVVHHSSGDDAAVGETPLAQWLAYELVTSETTGPKQRGAEAIPLPEVVPLPRSKTGLIIGGSHRK